MEPLPVGLKSWERTVRAVEAVKNRLLRATSALKDAGIDFAVVGGNAVAAWVGQIDQSAVRFTQDVDLLIRRSDLDAVTRALEAIGFQYRRSSGIDMFLDGPNAKARDAIHVIFAGERVRPDYAWLAPDVLDSDDFDQFRVLRLEPLIFMKLTSFRDKDRTHLRDMIDVGLIDDSWCCRLPAELSVRLKGLIDTPDG
jgi:hypothetical protein